MEKFNQMKISHAKSAYLDGDEKRGISEEKQSKI
jgi:hypothetical protein